MMRRDRQLFGFALAAVLAVPLAARAQDPAAAKNEEQALLAVLRSETPESEKAITCKRLAIRGSAAAVPDLAGLLGNERLASWARIALEAIPGPEADAALAAAADSLSGRLAIGAINSLGRRRVAALDLYRRKLADADPAVAEAAASAAGKSGHPEMAALLVEALGAGKPARDVVAMACVECGEQRQAAGDKAGAIALFDAVRGADVSEQRRAEAIRGLVLVKGKDGIPALVELLQSPAQRLFHMGLFTARELGGADDAALATEIDKALMQALATSATAEALRARRPLLIELLADRNTGGASAAVQQALLEAAKAGDVPVRLVAIRALGRCGGAASAGGLLEVATAAEPAVIAAVREAVAMMPAEGVDERIVSRLATADAASLPLVVGLIGDRRIVTAADKVLPLVDNGDPQVRAAALAALGSVIDLGTIDVLVRKAAAPRDEAEAKVATTALREAAVRMADRDGCAAKIAAAVGSAGPRAGLLVETLGEVGGGTALAAVAAAAKSGDQPLQDAATRVLGKWMTADAAPVLLELATTPAAGPYRGRALKGYLRIARQFVLPDAERAEMCRKALAAADDVADKKAVVEILVRYPGPQTLVVAREAAGVAEVAEEAKAAVAAIEAKLPKPAGAN